jgi:DNA polymerase I-like protein with 3'-5' exonuclease and polymerase domains
LEQKRQFQNQPQLYALFQIACEDLKILGEMERNGLAYDPDLITKRAAETRIEMEKVDKQLNSVYPELGLNFGSGDQLSAFLYGGTIKRIHREPVGVYKTGLKIGEVRYKLTEVEHQLPRLVEPLPKSELQKEGFYSTDEGTLRKLKGSAARKYVPLLLERARLEKLLGTYYEGIPKLVTKMNWEPGYIHGQFNQVVAATGRLSSVKPNLQNFAGEIEDVFISR